MKPTTTLTFPRTASPPRKFNTLAVLPLPGHGSPRVDHTHQHRLRARTANLYRCLHLMLCSHILQDFLRRDFATAHKGSPPRLRLVLHRLPLHTHAAVRLPGLDPVPPRR